MIKSGHVKWDEILPFSKRGCCRKKTSINILPKLLELQIVRNTNIQDIFLELTSMRLALRVELIQHCEKELKRFAWTRILFPSNPRPKNYFSL